MSNRNPKCVWCNIKYYSYYTWKRNLSTFGSLSFSHAFAIIIIIIVPVLHYLNTHLIQLHIVQTHPFYDDKCGHWCAALKAGGQRCGAALLGGADVLFLLRCLSVPVWKPRWGGGQRRLPGPEIWAAGKLTTTASFSWQRCCSLVDQSLLRCKWANLSPALNTFAFSIETTQSNFFLFPMSLNSGSEWL